MKSLIEFIKENKDTKYRMFVAPVEIQSSEYTFENFCKDAEIYDIDKRNDIEDIWKAYKCTDFVPGSYQYLGLSYEEWLYESEMIVASSKYVFDFIEKKYINNFIAFDKMNNKISSFVHYYFYGKVEDLNKVINDDEFIKYMNWANWSAYVTKDKKGRDCLLVTPNKTEIMTDKVYSFDKIYHYCPKFIYEDKIKKYGLQPKHKFGSKYEKIYCFWSKNPTKDMDVWARLKVRSTDNIYKKEKMLKDNFVVLTIDLSKCKEKIRFYKDEESNSENTFYTFEPIPPFAIVDVQDMNTKLEFS